MTEINQKHFEEIYLNNTNAKAAKMLKISTATLVSYAKKFGIKMKGQGRRKGQTKIKFIF